MLELTNVKLNEIADYATFRTVLGKELTASAESFVRIGYLLKQARDTEILQESGYGSLTDFAKAEYGLSKDVVSRYIAINDKFSEGGNSETLRLEYQGFGYTKLAEMLTLPDSLVEDVSLDMTREEIREIKEAVKEEAKVTDIEIAIERAEQQVPLTPHAVYEQALKQVFHGAPDLFRAAYIVIKEQAGTEDDKPKRLKELLFPAGYGLYESRVKGVGGIWISGTEDKIRMTMVRADEKIDYTYEDTVELMMRWVMDAPESVEATWEHLYDEPLPFKQEVAPAQPQKVSTVARREKPKPEPKPQPKPKPEPKPEPVPEPIEDFMPAPVEPEKPEEPKPEPVQRSQTAEDEIWMRIERKCSQLSAAARQQDLEGIKTHTHILKTYIEDIEQVRIVKE